MAHGIPRIYPEVEVLILAASLLMPDAAMSSPLTLTFRHLPRSGALEASARDIGQRLRRLHRQMTACHIVLEGNGSGPGANGPYQVKIHLSVPGAQIHAASVHTEDGRPLHSAYESARRQLEKLNRLQH